MFKRPAVLACIVDLVILCISVFLIFVFHLSPSVVYGIALASIAIVTFGFFYSDTPNSGADDASVRTAVAATFVIVYFVFLSLFVFSPSLRRYIEGEPENVAAENTSGAEPVPSPFGRELFSTFTTLVGTVVSFYVASSAVVTATDRYSRAKFTATDASTGASADADAKPPEPG